MDLKGELIKLWERVKRHPIVSVLIGIVTCIGAYDTTSATIAQVTDRQLPSLRRLFGMSVDLGGSLLPWWAWLIFAQSLATLLVAMIARDAVAELKAGVGAERLQDFERQLALVRRIAQSAPLKERLIKRAEQFRLIQKGIDAAWERFNLVAQDATRTRALSGPRFGWGEAMEGINRISMEVTTFARHTFREDMWPEGPPFIPYLPAPNEPTHDEEKRAGFRKVYHAYQSTKRLAERISRRFDDEIAKIDEFYSEAMGITYW